MSNDSATLTRSEVKAERAKAIEYLRGEYLKPGDTVYVILRHVSQSGMSRFVDLYVVLSKTLDNTTYAKSEIMRT